MNRVEFLADATQRSTTTDPVRVTIRELIGYWDAKGRGSRVRTQIRQALRQKGLRTVPDFTIGFIDNWVTLLPVDDPNTTQTVASPEADLAEEESEERYLRVDSLRCASQGIASVEPDAPIAKALTIMALNDYSQLAVGSGLRHINRAITWESIGRSRILADPVRVSDASVPVTTVNLTDDLLPLLPTIADLGFVFVQDQGRLAVGIVTAADVTNEFGALAEPFFLIGEVERRLRSWLRRAGFSKEEFASARFEADDERDVAGPEDLTFGELERMIESSENWNRIPWQLERKIFLERLGEIRAVRNSLMHFSSDVPSQADTALMRNLLSVLSGANWT